MGMGKSITECAKCGLPWIGTDKCSCGWTPNPWLIWVKLLVVVLIIGLIAGGIFLGSKYREFFPDPEAAKIHVAKGDDELDRGNFNDSIREFQEALALDPKQPITHRKLAWAMYNDKRHAEGLQEMQRSYDLNPKDKQTQKDLAYFLEQNGDDDKAAKIWEAYAASYPNEKMTIYHLGEMYEKLDNYPKAEEYYKKYLKINPRVNGPWISMSRLKSKQNKDDECIYWLREGLKVLPHDSVMHQRLGIELADQNKKDEAIKELTYAAQLEPAQAEYNSGIISKVNGFGPQEQYMIPLTKVGHSFAVDAVINEKKHVRLIVDSGAEVVAITPSIARSLGLKPGEGIPMVMQGVNSIDVTQGYALSSIRIGQAKELFVNATVIPSDGGIDGLLGMSFLGRYDFSLDAQKKILTLRRRGNG